MGSDGPERDLDRIVLDHLPVLAAYLDRTQCYRFVNEAYGAFFGFTATEVLTKHISDLLGPDLYSSVVDEILGALSGVPQEFERSVTTPHGVRHVRVHYLPDVHDGEVEGFVIQTLDITERRLAAIALRRAEERFRTLFEAAPTATLLTDRTGSIVAANAATGKLLGYERSDLEGRRASDLIHPDEHVSALGIQHLLFDEGAANYSGERRYLRADGSTIWAQADITLITGTDEDEKYLLAQLQDIGARKRYEAQLEFLADHDALTGLLNRRGFQNALEAQAWENQTTASDAVVLVLDLDGFKAVNDQGGHDAGDRLLIEVADVLQRALGTGSTIARLGGDEFAMILPGPLSDATAAAGAAIVTAVDQATAATAEREGRPGHHVTASAGIAAFTRHLTGDRALTSADQAMYRAKNAGRNRLSD